MTRNPTQRDLLDMIKKLQDRVRNLERSRQLPNSAVDQGSVVVNNGQIVAKHPNGTELFRTGVGETTLPFDVDPTSGYLTRIRRGNGQVVFESFTADDGGEARAFLCDRNGNVILDEDWLIGRGLGRPFIGWKWYTPAEDVTPPQLVTSGTFVDVYNLYGNIQHPTIQARVRVYCDIGTTGEIRIQDTFFGTTQWSNTITSGFNSAMTAVANIHGLRNYGDDGHMVLQARRTSGAGNIRIGIHHIYGRTALSL